MATEQRREKQKLGEMLVEHGLITINQLKDALTLQAQSGGRLGSILVDLGHLDVDRLLEFLGRQFGVPAANLAKLQVDPSLLELLPFEKMKQYKVLPLVVGNKDISLAMVNPNNLVTISDLEFMLGESIKPVVVLSSQMEAALKAIEGKEDMSAASTATDAPAQKPKSVEEKPVIREYVGGVVDMEHLFRMLVHERASDLLLSAGVPPCLKKDNEVRRISAPSLSPEEIRSYASELMSETQKQEFERTKEIDFAVTFPEVGRFRLNIYQQRHSLSIAVRHIAEIVPTLDELGLPRWLEDFALKTQGLILVTGPVGHGKTTTLAAIVDIINAKRRCNIITIEDPIEYLHKHKASNVNQREVGVDTESFHAGLRHVFRESPDVIIIGEMRDPESFAISLQAAETGHLVVSTLHSSSSTSTVDRIIDIFPPYQQPQIRVQLAENLLLILNQRLVPLKNTMGRVLAYEKLVNSYRVRNLIREGKSHQIRSMLQQSTEDFLSIDHSLARLCIEGKITQEAGGRFCENLAYYNDLVTRGSLR